VCVLCRLRVKVVRLKTRTSRRAFYSLAGRSNLHTRLFTVRV